MLKTYLFSLLVFLSVSSAAFGLVNGQAPAEDDTRFDAVAAFSQTKWLTADEAGNGGHNWFGAGVLIAPDVVLIARHLLPPHVISGKTLAKGTYMVRFRRNAEGTLGSKEVGPDSFHNVPVMRWVISDHADLALGILASPVEHIKPVSVLLDEREVKEERCILAGWGSESPWRGNRSPRTGLKIGENTATARGAGLSILSGRTEIREKKNGTRGAYVIDENAVVNMYDSGGSIFLLDPEGNPILAGIISTYSGGTFLPGVIKNTGFPIEPATRGARALIDALENKPNESGPEQSHLPESNRQPAVYKTAALPIELRWRGRA